MNTYFSKLMNFIQHEAHECVEVNIFCKNKNFLKLNLVFSSVNSTCCAKIRGNLPKKIV